MNRLSQTCLQICLAGPALAAMLITTCAHAQTNVRVISTIDTAEFVLEPGPELPESDAWHPVTLTDRWPLERYDRGREGWYRINITLKQQPVELIGIYLRRVNMNAQLFLNGSLIVDGGQFDEPIARNWNFPMYAEPPPGLWREGLNTLHIRHISYRGYGYLSPIYIGPAQLLRSEYQTALLMQVQIARYLFPVTAVTGLFVFGIWLRRKKDKAYLWFSVAIAAWSFYIVNMFVRNLVIPTRLWEWMAHLAIELWVVAFLVFTYHFVGLRLGKLAWALVAYLVLAAIIYALGDLHQLKSNVAVFHAVSLGIVFALIARLIAHWLRSRAAGVLPITGGLLVLLATGVHDWMFQTGITSVTGTLSLHLHYYCAPLVFAFIAWHLTSRFALAVDELEDLNLHLEQRIADTEAELSARFEQIKTMEQRQLVLNERDRIAREIHDAVGGRFSSAIMMTDIIRKETPEQGRIDALRSLLSDGLMEVRHLVTAMVGDIGSSADLIYYIADKAGATLRSVDIELQADFKFADQSWPVSNSQALNVVRVFQEATNNIIKHSTADSVVLEASDASGALKISISDNGVGLPGSGGAKSSGHTEGTRSTSYGIAGMRKRCEEMGATMSIANNDSGGCVVTLSLAARS